MDIGRNTIALACLTIACLTACSDPPTAPRIDDMAMMAQPGRDMTAIPDLTAVPDLTQPSEAAGYFCQAHDRFCGFGQAGHYANYKACTSAYDGYSKMRQNCVASALSTAVMDPSRCPVAAGGPPCDKE